MLKGFKKKAWSKNCFHSISIYVINKTTNKSRFANVNLYAFNYDVVMTIRCDMRYTFSLSPSSSLFPVFTISFFPVNYFSTNCYGFSIDYNARTNVHI